MREAVIQVKFNKSSPKYLSIALSIREAIKIGQLRPGEILPSSRELAKQLKVNRHTIMGSLKELESEGWITSFEKKYYRVNADLPDKYLNAKVIDYQKQNEPNLSFVRKVDGAEYSSSPKGLHSFPSGRPDLRLFPVQEFHGFLKRPLSRSNSLDYTHPKGSGVLIDQIKEYLRRLRGIDDIDVAITNGSQEAIFFVGQLFTGPKSIVAVEEKSYLPAVNALRYAGGKIVGIPVDREGLVVDALEKLAKQKRVDLVYLTPLHQYPTTVTLSPRRRLQLYEVAEKYGIQILEDDYDHEFHYSSQPLAPLASFDPSGRVLYVSTFSKILFPSARIGFIAAHPKIIREVTKLKRITSRQNDQILQIALAKWMESGGFERHLRKMRRTYEERKNSLVKTLNKMKVKHPSLNFMDPDGGMSIWLDTGMNSKLLSERSLKLGLSLNPENIYRLDQKAGTHIRIGFSGFSPLENDHSLMILDKVFTSNLGHLKS